MRPHLTIPIFWPAQIRIQKEDARPQLCRNSLSAFLCRIRNPKLVAAQNSKQSLGSKQSQSPYKFSKCLSALHGFVSRSLTELLKMTAYIDSRPPPHFSLPKPSSCLFFAATHWMHFHPNKIAQNARKEKCKLNNYPAFLSEFEVLFFCWRSYKRGQVGASLDLACFKTFIFLTVHKCKGKK